MYVFLFILAILIIILVLLAIIPLKIYFSGNLDFFPEFNINVSWLFSLFKLSIIGDKNAFVTLKVHVLKKLIKNKQLTINTNHKSSNNIGFIKSLKLKHVKLKTHYGFKDPSFTGLFYGFINSITEYMNVDFLYVKPDFNTENCYLNASGFVELNLITTFINYYKFHSKKPNKKLLYLHK